MRLIAGVVRPYAWGSRVSLAALRGMPVPSPHPEAELWFGAHPASPSPWLGDAGAQPGDGEDLLAAIEHDACGELGASTVSEFGDRLPYLVKVLAAEEPLSLQAHPTSEQAAQGYARENDLGVPLDAPERNYRDRYHKPELIVALTEFEALAGFRDPQSTIELLRALQTPELDSYLGLLVGSPDSSGLRALFTTWITLPDPTLQTLIPAVLDGAVRYLNSGGTVFARECRTVLELGEMYPADPGVLAAMLLNRISLQPGQALYLGAGNLHAYLYGTGVEIMASSDNVLRGGLTTKHVDVPELLRVLDFTPVALADLSPTVRNLNAERIYLTPAADFRLSRVELDGTGLVHASSISFDMPGPQILLTTAGAIEVRPIDGSPSATVPAGAGAWIPDSDPDVVVHAAASRAVFYRALVPGLATRPVDESGTDADATDLDAARLVG